MRDLQERLAGYEAASLAAGAEEVNGVREVIQALDGRDQNTLKSMALAICGAPGFQVALFTTVPPYNAVIARLKDGNERLRRRPARRCWRQFGGRGGGKPELALGGGLNGDLAQILAAARANSGTGVRVRARPAMHGLPGRRPDTGRDRSRRSLRALCVSVVEFVRGVLVAGFSHEGGQADDGLVDGGVDCRTGAR